MKVRPSRRELITSFLSVAAANAACRRAVAAPLPGEALFIKQGSSGFIGTGLADHLSAEGITGLVIVGGAANYCVESTARMAGSTHQCFVMTLKMHATICSTCWRFSQVAIHMPQSRH